jgi:hypothetical protein
MKYSMGNGRQPLPTKISALSLNRAAPTMAIFSIAGSLCSWNEKSFHWPPRSQPRKPSGDPHRQDSALHVDDLGAHSGWPSLQDLPVAKATRCGSTAQCLAKDEADGWREAGNSFGSRACRCAGLKARAALAAVRMR